MLHISRLLNVTDKSVIIDILHDKINSLFLNGKWSIR